MIFLPRFCIRCYVNRNMSKKSNQEPDPTDIAKDTSPNPQRLSQSGILSRFVSLLSAQGVDGAVGGLFFLYLAWVNSSDYGQIMYALAAGSIVFTVIQFGLYYPLVSELGASDKDQSPSIINRVFIIKMALFVPAILSIIVIAWQRNLSWELSLVLISISLGFAAEAIADTFFADLRVRGFQSTEARIKIQASIASYVYGFGAAALGLNPVIISLFKLVSSVIRIALALSAYIKDYPSGIFVLPHWLLTKNMFMAAIVFAMIEILGIIYNKTNIFFLEKYAGVTGVAFYSATWNIVDAISVLASEQFLGWVIFPLLAGLWLNRRQEAQKLIRSNAQWLSVFAFPIMFFLSAESSLIIGAIYPAEYKDAVWMQQYLVWTILLSFQNNLFSYVMMVSGAAKILLAVQAVATVANLAFNYFLVSALGLKGACLVIILTKLVTTSMTFSFCRFYLNVVSFKDFLFPVAMAVFLFSGFEILNRFINVHAAVILMLGIYMLLLINVGPRIMGPMPGLVKKTVHHET